MAALKAHRAERPANDAGSLTALDKENAELRRLLGATMKQVRTLQNDIAAVHASTHAQMDEVTSEYVEKIRQVQESSAAVADRNEIVAAQLLRDTQMAEDVLKRVDDARQKREAAESEVAAQQCEVEGRKQTLADLDAEVADMRSTEAELSAEIKSLEHEKRSGVVNLEHARAKNAEEAKELAAEEAKLAEGSRRVDALREQILTLRHARQQARTSH
jgi:chromosome segregation ATPase